jgi:Uncharacterized protein conserved in bacteria (DUF2252)
MAVKEAAPRYRRINHPSLDERLDQGRTARDRTPPSSHAGWSPAADRPDPVGLLEEQDRTREPDLVPVRHVRLMVSPFTFYRGAAHARSGDPVAMAESLAGDDAFDQSITDFCERYADQKEQDYEEFAKAVRSGRLEAVEGV